MSFKKYFIKKKEKETVEAEEIFLDAAAIRSMEDKGKMEKPIKPRNFVVFYILVVLTLIGLFLRGGYLQAVKGEYYRDLAQGNRLRIYSIPAGRGIIYDRFLNPLVYNVPSFDLAVQPVDFLGNPDEVQEEILDKLTEAVNSGQKGNLVDKKNLKALIEQNQGRVTEVVLVKDIEHSVALVLESLAGDWPGVYLNTSSRRNYLYGSPFSHLLGYTGQAGQSDLAAGGYSFNDQVGKAGLEFQYEELLRGEPGQRQMEVNSLGRTQNFLAAKPAKPGQSLALFVDKELQNKLYQSLFQALSQLKVKKAAGVAIDPRDGGVLAMVSLPDFDNNLFSQGILSAELEKLENNPNHPFLNRAIAGLYPPGSTIKPLIAAAALEEKIVSPAETIFCSGSISVVNQYNPEIVYYFNDWKAHGLTDIKAAIAESCNVFFYGLAGGYGRIEGLGISRIKKYLQDFGLGRFANIDLPGEENGLIPDKEWKEKEKPDENWYLGDTFHAAIGQGDIQATPLQIAMAVAAIANNGVLYRPRFVDKIMDAERRIVKDTPAKIVNKDFIKPANLKTVQEGMRHAVTSGSARLLLDLPVSAAGKTGTAQFGDGGKTHAWFVGFAPYQQPEIALAVIVEEGGEGSSVAVPVAKEVLEWYFNQRTENK